MSSEAKSKERVVKGKIEFDFCVNLGHARLNGKDLSTYCFLCVKGEANDDIHKNLDCKNCPDYEAYSYDFEYV